MAKNLQIPQKQGKFKYKAQIIEKSHTEGLAKKEKRAKKMQGKNSIWDGYYTTLQLMAS